MIKLIIFDLDGVLVSAKEAKSMHYKALNEALRWVDEKYMINMDEHLSTFDGLSTTQKLKLLTELKGLPQSEYKDIWENKQKITWDIITETFSQDLRIQKILSYLHGNQFKIAVASNAVRRTVMLMLLKKGLLEHVDFFISNEDISTPKPYPEMYWKCMKMAKTIPSETLIIEDSHIGREAAYNSGAHLLGIKDSPDLTVDLVMDKINKINKLNLKKNHEWQGGNMNILIPMAGAGKRFENAGFTFPKPLIDINGKPMIQVVVENLNIQGKYIFIVRREHWENYSLRHIFNIIAPENQVIILDELTEGAACTTLLAEGWINTDEPLLIANSDQFVEWNSNIAMYSFENSEIDGGILTFNATHPKWSFVKLDENGLVIEVAEKQPISDIATVGVYYWARGSDYVKYAKQMIEKDIRTNGEFYVAPVFNEAIADGAKIKPYFVDRMWGLGTPEDLTNFLKNYNGGRNV